MAVRHFLRAQLELAQASSELPARTVLATVNPQCEDEYDGEAQAAFELGIHSGFDSD
jgi:hypothetical protein